VNVAGIGDRLAGCSAWASRMNKRWWAIGAVGGLLGLVALGVAAQASKGASAPAGQAASAARPALSVQTVAPQSTPIRIGLSAHGSVAAWQEASVGSEVQGLRLAEVRAQVGDTVKKGQVLAVFASETLRAELAQLKAAVAEAEASLAEAAGNAQRARDLQSSGALSGQQIQQMLTAERVAQARLDAQRAAVMAAEVRLKQTEVLAPDNGVVSVRTANVGAVMPAGQELFRLIRQGRLEWRAEVPASELPRLKPGMAATVTPPGGTPVAGKVRLLAPTVDAATRNGIVHVDLPNPGAARAGMFAAGEFEVSERSGLTLPQSAVVLRDGFSYVFTVDAQSKVRQQKVELGRRQGDRVEVVSGLPANAKVVASGGGFLGDGDLVRVVGSP
jgi:HlyD family secretion protein